MCIDCIAAKATTKTGVTIWQYDNFARVLKTP
jgi:hypothetical protein